MYFDYIVKNGGARFNELKTNVFALMRQDKNNGTVKGDGLFINVGKKDRYSPKESYILSDGKNTLHLEFNDRGRVVAGTSYSSNQVRHMVGELGKEVIIPAGAP